MKTGRIYLRPRWLLVWSAALFVAVCGGWAGFRFYEMKRAERLQAWLAGYGGGVDFTSRGMQVERWLVDNVPGIDSQNPHFSYMPRGIKVLGIPLTLGNFLDEPHSISLSGSPSVSLEELKQIPTFDSIQMISLKVSTLSDVEAKIIAHSKGVQYLDLSTASISDDGIDALAQCPELIALYLVDCPVTDDSVDAFLQMKKLESLDLGGTAITADGLISLLAQHSTLEDVALETDLTPEERKILAERAPDWTRGKSSWGVPAWKRKSRP